MLGKLLSKSDVMVTHYFAKKTNGLSNGITPLQIKSVNRESICSIPFFL